MKLENYNPLWLVRKPVSDVHTKWEEVQWIYSLSPHPLEIKIEAFYPENPVMIPFEDWQEILQILHDKFEMCEAVWFERNPISNVEEVLNDTELLKDFFFRLDAYSLPLSGLFEYEDSGNHRLILSLFPNEISDLKQHNELVQMMLLLSQLTDCYINLRVSNLKFKLIGCKNNQIEWLMTEEALQAYYKLHGS